MLTIENFKRSVDLCEERSVLMEISQEINAQINNPPISLELFKRKYISDNTDKGLIMTICYFTMSIAGVGLYMLWEKGILSLPIAVILILAYPVVMYFWLLQSKKRKLLKKGKNTFLSHEQKIKKYYEIERPALLRKREELNSDIENVVKELRSFDGVPDSEWDIASELWYLYSTHQADSYKEAVWLWRDIQHKIATENAAKEQVRLAEQAARYSEESKNYAHQAMVESEKARKVAEVNLMLEAYNTYKISQL